MLALCTEEVVSCAYETGNTKFASRVESKQPRAFSLVVGTADRGLISAWCEGEEADYNSATHMQQGTMHSDTIFPTAYCTWPCC